MKLPELDKVDMLAQTPEVREEALKQLEQAMWDRGRLRHMCLPNAQTQLYDAVHKRAEEATAEPLVMMCHRRLGKSHLSALLCIERCLSKPGSEVWFTSDTTEHCRDFLEGKLIDTFATMPPWISYRTRRNTYYFRNNKWPKGVESKLTLKGLDYQQGGAIRGGASDLTIVDEAREVKHLEFVVKRVLLPMFKGRKNPTLLIFSTPAESLAHDFHRVYVQKARMSGSFIKIGASDNPDFTKDDEKLMLSQYGSKEDIGWRREIECEEIADTSAMLVPEWPDISEEFTKDKIEPPSYYRGYVACDLGYKDHSGIVFARYDFLNSQIQIIDEIFVNYADSEKITQLMVEKIEENFPEDVRGNLDICADTTALTLADLNRFLYDKGYYVREADKYDRDASLNALRANIRMGKILIQANCKELDYQLKNACWNKTRKSFERTVATGHADLIAALVYLHKAMKWHENPFPVDAKVGVIAGRFHSPYNRENKSHRFDEDTIQALEGIYGRKIKR